MAPEELQGRLAALDLALVIALEGRRLNPEYAQIVIDQETSGGMVELALFYDAKLDLAK